MSAIAKQLQSFLYQDRSQRLFLADIKMTPLGEMPKPFAEVDFKVGSSLEAKEKKTHYFSLEQTERFNLLQNDKFLNKRFITHLFGDSFMQDTIYEGWFVSDALMHMIAILKENEITPEISEVLRDLKKCLEWHNKIISYCEPFPPDKENNTEDVVDVDLVDDTEQDVEAPTPNKLADEIKAYIQQLEIGHKLLFPGGCIQHSVLYEVKRVDKDEFMVGVYNSGMGSIKHMQFIENEGDHKIVGIYRLHHVKLEKIVNTSLIQDLLELNKALPTHFTSRLYDEILPTLEGEKDEQATDPSQYMLKQRSGICVWKMLSAYCRYNLPLIQRKYVKLKARLGVFQKWYDLGYPLDCLKISQSLLEKLIVNHKFEIYGDEGAPMNFSREELLAMGIYKAKKTFNKYKMLLGSHEIQQAETWYSKFTGQSIHEV